MPSTSMRQLKRGLTACAVMLLASLPAHPKLTAARARADRVTDPRGIYVGISNPFPLKPEQQKLLEPPLAAALAQDGVDGLLLTVAWAGLEQTMGHYMWELSPDNPFDNWIAQATSSGKKVEIAVRSDLTPPWLFDEAGAFPLHFTYTTKASQKGCHPTDETIAAAWDPVFLAQWNDMLTALAYHLRTTALADGTREYDAVQMLRLTGIDRNSGELHLPSQTPESPNTPCVSDAIATWLQEPFPAYRPSKLLQGWDGITSAFKRHFPDKDFSVAIIASSNPFPPIAEDGSLIVGVPPGQLSEEQNLPLLTLADQRFPGHLVIQNNSLYEGVPAQRNTVRFARSLAAMLAFQTNLELGQTGGASCMKGSAKNPPQPCVGSGDFLSLLNTGIYPHGPTAHLRAQYIEVFAPNVNAFPDAIWQAHEELTTPPRVALSFPDPPAPRMGWYNGPVTGTVTADSTAGTAITDIRCGQSPVTASAGLGTAAASASVTVSGEGALVRVACVATDAAGDVTQSQYPLRIDTTPPVTTATTRLISVSGVPTSLLVIFAATDALSGVASTEFSLDRGGTWTRRPAVALCGGAYTVLFRSADVAGNVERRQSIAVTAPTCTTGLDGFFGE